ncbi:hypothetical protein Tco_1197870, partial [Tanacetum coccineum]
ASVKQSGLHSLHSLGTEQQKVATLKKQQKNMNQQQTLEPPQLHE